MSGKRGEAKVLGGEPKQFGRDASAKSPKPYSIMVVYVVVFLKNFIEKKSTIFYEFFSQKEFDFIY